MRCAFAAIVLVLTACNAGNSSGLHDGGAAVPTPGADANAPVSVSSEDGTNPVNSTANPVPVARDPQLHAHADVAMQQLMLQFWSNGQFTNTWNFAQALDVVVDNVQRTNGRAYSGAINTVFNGIALHGYSNFGTVYYDDENWLALALIRAYRLAAFQPALAQNANAWLNEALSRYAIVQSGEVFDASGNTQGVWWSSDDAGMACASNAPSSLTASLLYEITGDAKYLTMAKRLYDHWYNVAVDHTTYQVADGVARDGTAPNFAWQFTYNYGGMIGAALELHKLTGDSKYLTDARGYAAYELAHLYTMVDGKEILDDACQTTCTGDAEEFKGIGFRYLVSLAQMDPNNSVVQDVLNNSAASIFANAYNANAGTFFTDWAGPASANAQLGSQTAASMALATLGTTALTQPQHAYAADVYEAEEAYVNGPTLEALYGGFTGWGYVAAWGSDGQAVTFTVSVPADGNYLLTWRYTANADAVRALTVPAEHIAINIALPGTNGYTAYTTASTPVFLHAGTQPITLAFSNSASSKSFVNLDQLRVTTVPQSTTCTPPTPPTLVSPVLDEGACGNANFVWTSTTEPTSYAVVLDGNTVCTAPGGTHSCTAALSRVSAGRHNWSVRATNGCRTTSSDAGELNSAAAVVTSLQNVSLHKNTLSWTAPPAAENATVDVLVNGALTCSQLLTTQCLLPAVARAAGSNAVVAVVRNACAQVPAPAMLF